MNVQNTLFVGGVLLLLRALGRQPARLRYRIGVVGLLKLFVLPLFMLPGTTTALALLSYEHTVALAPSASASSPALSLTAVLMGGWMAVASGLLGLALWRTARLYRHARGAAPVDGVGVMRVGGKVVSVLQSPHVQSPLVLGLWRPRVLVPPTWNTWPASCRRAVLAHEAAHIRRCDLWIHAASTVAHALYFFNPLVWLLNRALAQYAEMACDEAAMAASGLSVDGYARQLVYVAEHAPRTRPLGLTVRAVASSYTAVKKRLTYLLGDRSVGWGRVQQGCLMGALLVALIPLSSQYAVSQRSLPQAAASASPRVFIQPIRYEPPEPVGGYETLEHRLASQREVQTSGGEREGDVRVHVRLDADGAVLATEHVKGGCNASYTEIREAILDVRWEPARENGNAVSADLHLTFANAEPK